VTIEDSAELLKNYRITNSFPIDGWCRFSDYFYEMKLEGKRKALITSCGISNAPKEISSPRFWVLGFLGLRIVRQFALLFTKDQKGACSFMKRMSTIPDVDAVIFMHGDNIIGEGANKKLAGVSCTHSIFSF